MIQALRKHEYYGGIDLHARKMNVCIIDNRGKKIVRQNIKTQPEMFFELIFPYLDDIAIGAECVFAGTGCRIYAPNAISALSLVMQYT